MTVTARRNVTEIETYTGRFVDLLNPQPEQICLEDIAVGLSNTCRFAGQVTRFYSVAEHSVRCCNEFAWPAHRRAALFHDAHEAYTGDITAPMKKVLEDTAPGVLAEMQQRLDIAIAQRFGVVLEAFKEPKIKEADDYMMYREAAGLKYSHGIGEHWANGTYYAPLVGYGWEPAEAERRFIETYERLSHVNA